MDLNSEPVRVFTLLAGLVNAGLAAWAVATAGGGTPVIVGVGFASAFIPAAAGQIARSGVVPLDRVTRALDAVESATSTAEAGVRAARELEKLTRAEATAASPRGVRG